MLLPLMAITDCCILPIFLYFVDVM